MSEQSELEAGTVLGAYRILRTIGVGGMGTVYEGEHQELRKKVAVKVPHAMAAHSSEGRARFVREGKTAAKLRHPHVVDITDVGEANDVAYLVMEYLEGESLASLVRREAPLAPEAIADIFLPVVAALQEAHSMGIVHRDLKPDNIFLTRSVQGGIHPKLLDFGISKVLGEKATVNLTLNKGFLGTPSYIAPEQLRSEGGTGHKSDQYSLGVVLYEAATGSNPFDKHPSLMGVLAAISNADLPAPREAYPGIDSRLEAIIARAIALEPSERYASMGALGHDLLGVASADTRSAWTRYFSAFNDEPEPESDPEIQDYPRFGVLPWGPGVWASIGVAVMLLAVGGFVFKGWAGRQSGRQPPLLPPADVTTTLYAQAEPRPGAGGESAVASAPAAAVASAPAAAVASAPAASLRPQASDVASDPHGSSVQGAPSAPSNGEVLAGGAVPERPTSPAFRAPTPSRLNAGPSALQEGRSPRDKAASSKTKPKSKRKSNAAAAPGRRTESAGSPSFQGGEPVPLSTDNVDPWATPARGPAK